jgi:hypothetical protein
MKTVKFLIAIAILSTSFYACKKEQMILETGESHLTGSSQNKIKTEDAIDGSDGVIKVIFNRVGTMIIQGNPNLEKLINMYDASSTAIASAKTLFESDQKDELSVIFDREGRAISSDIPKIQIGSSIDAFIFDFCNLKPATAMNLSISKNNISRNYEEFWNSLPEGANQKFLAEIKNIQDELPMNYSIQVSFTENQNPSIIYLDENGNPQPTQNSPINCLTIGSGFIVSFHCLLLQAGSWI